MRSNTAMALCLAATMAPGAVLAQAVEEAGPLMQRLDAAVAHGGAILDGARLAWDELHIDADGTETYRGLVIADEASGGGELVIDELRLAGDGGAGVIEIAGEGISIEEGSGSLAVASLRTRLDPEYLSSTGEILFEDPMELCRMPADGALLELGGVTFVEGQDSASLDGLAISTEGRRILNLCALDYALAATGFRIESQDGRFAVDEVYARGLRPADVRLPDAPTGVEFFDSSHLRGLQVSAPGVGLITLEDMAYEARYDADSLIDLAGTGIDELFLQVAMPGAHSALGDPGDLLSSISISDVWNAIRAVETHGRIEISRLSIDPGAFMAPLDAIGPLTLDLAFGTSMSDGQMSDRLKLDLDPLVGLEISSELQLREAADIPVGTPFEMALMQLPVGLSHLEVSVDERGLDGLALSMTGSDLATLLEEPLQVLQPAQREAVLSWIESGMGEGKSAYLELSPDAPMPVLAMVPLLMGNWQVFGEMMNAKTSP